MINKYFINIFPQKKTSLKINILRDVFLEKLLIDKPVIYLIRYRIYK